MEQPIRLGRGEVQFSEDSGKIEMTGYTPDDSDLTFLKDMLLGYFQESELEETDWAEGFAITPSGEQWTRWTAYVSAEPRHFSLFEALPDIFKGIDIEDETLLASIAEPGEFRGALEVSMEKAFTNRA